MRRFKAGDRIPLRDGRVLVFVAIRRRVAVVRFEKPGKDSPQQKKLPGNREMGIDGLGQRGRIEADTG